MPSILILGGGVAGLRTAQLLSKRLKGCLITVVDQQDRHQSPYSVHATLLHGIANVPLHKVGQRYGFKALRANVIEINIDQQEVVTTDRSFTFDYLVTALGSVPDVDTVLGARGHVLPAWSTAEWSRIAHSIDFLLNSTHYKRPVQGVRIAVVGGGRVGAETAAHIAEYVAMKSTARAHIQIFEAASRLLSHYALPTARIVERYLEQVGVEVNCNTSVTAISAHAVTTEDGEQHEADLIVWAGPNKAVACPTTPQVQANSTGRVLVNNCLQIRPYVNLFAIGDIATAPILHRKPSTEETLQEASYIASVLPLLLKNQRIPPYMPKPQPELISLGSKAAVYVYKNIARIGALYAARYAASRKRYYRELVS